MSLAELLPAVRALDADDKRALMQTLADDLADQDVLKLITNATEFPVWSPYESYEAAAQLQKLLEEHKSREAS